MTALVQVRNMLFNLRQDQCPMPTREEAIRALEGIEAGIIAATPSGCRGPKLTEALLALASFDGCAPMQLGQKLDPTKEGYRAGSLGTTRLFSLRQAGFAEKVHFGWWKLTDAGRAEAERLRAGGSA